MTSVYITATLYKLVAICVTDIVGYYFFVKINKKIMAKLLTLGSLGLALLIMYKFLKTLYLLHFHKEVWRLV